MKRVRGAMLVGAKPTRFLYPAAPFRATLPSRRMSACNEVCMLKFSSTEEGITWSLFFFF